jgi:hypothetical protein
MGESEPVQVLIVGDGERATAFRALVERSPRTTLAATVSPATRERVAAALVRHPDARVVIALPPRAALEAALEVAAAGRRGLVEAPLPLWAGGQLPARSGVQVAHGWVTLGRRWFEQVIARGVSNVELLVEGLPEAPGGDLEEVVVHALALLRRLFPGAEPRSVRLQGEGALQADFEAASGVRIELRARTSGQRLDARATGDGFSATWRWQPDEEIRELHAGRSAVRRVHSAGGSERALAQLLDPDRHGGDTLADASAVLALSRRTLALLPHPLPIGARRFHQAAARERRYPDDPLAPLGLRGPLEAGPDAGMLEVPRLQEPFELWSFRAGLKPVVFLTLDPSEVQRTRRWFNDAHVEVRERRVASDVHDTWVDRRDLGEPRVELYISRDAALARRAAELQAGTDPSAAARELGELMGYPACCVEAFSELADRSNNSRNRYATAARTPPGRWPWELDNFFVMLVPFFPCRYDCDRALGYARAALAELEQAHPGARADLQRMLSRPVLYFSHQQLLVFDGSRQTGQLEYRGVEVARDAPAGFRRLARMAAAADGLVLDDTAIRFFRGRREWATLERTDPALGVIADFSAGEAPPVDSP